MPLDALRAWDDAVAEAVAKARAITTDSEEDRRMSGLLYPTIRFLLRGVRELDRIGSGSGRKAKGGR